MNINLHILLSWLKSGNPSQQAFCHLYFYFKIMYYRMVMWLKEGVSLKILLSGSFKGTRTTEISGC